MRCGLCQHWLRFPRGIGDKMLAINNSCDPFDPHHHRNGFLQLNPHQSKNCRLRGGRYTSPRLASNVSVALATLICAAFPRPCVVRWRGEYHFRADFKQLDQISAAGVVNRSALLVLEAQKGADCKMNASLTRFLHDIYSLWGNISSSELQVPRTQWRGEMKWTVE